MKQTTKITVEYDLPDIKAALAAHLYDDGFNLESIEPRYTNTGDDRFGGGDKQLSSIICHVTKKPPSNYGPYDR